MFQPSDSLNKKEYSALLGLLLAPALRPFLVLLSDVGSLGAALRALEDNGAGIPDDTLLALCRAGYEPERVPSYEAMTEAIMGMRLALAVTQNKMPLQKVANKYGLDFVDARKCLNRFEEYNVDVPRRKRLKPWLRL